MECIHAVQILNAYKLLSPQNHFNDVGNTTYECCTLILVIDSFSSHINGSLVNRPQEKLKNSPLFSEHHIQEAVKIRSFCRLKKIKSHFFA